MGRGKSKRRHRTDPPPPPPAPQDAATARRARWIAVVALVIVGAALAAMALLRSDDQPTHLTRSPMLPAAPATAPVKPAPVDAFADYAGSESCRECHAGAYEGWWQSHHALAERALNAQLDHAAFSPARTLKSAGGETTEFSAPTTKPADYRITITDPGGNKQAMHPQRVIGHTPLRQFLIGTTGGRMQAAQAAFDPHKNEWFDVFGDDVRRPGDWGHWAGRGMNWNAMCAACHNTRLQKNYDPAADTYNTRMAEMSIGCESCHGPMEGHVEWQKVARAATQNATTTTATTRPRDPTIKPINRDLAYDTCGSCHSRRGEITSDFVPGDPYHDHYNLAIVDESDVYYADGQVREEDYEFAAYTGSRMHAAGVRCVDCHNAHTGKLVLEGDLLCMRCHQGIETYPTAPIIKPAEHVFHKPESSGARCVNCHMPQTTFMQRDERHDHGMSVPDPLLTKEHGIPNACNRCHWEKDADWTIEAVDKWYGKKMDRPSRQRTRWIAAAKQGQESARQPLIDLLGNEKETGYWKAVATGLLARWIGQGGTEQAVLAQLDHPDPLVRTQAARTLEPLIDASADVRSAMQRRLEDPSRAVRVAAGWSLRQWLDADSLAGRDLRRMLDVNADQPLGQLQAAHYAMARHNLPEALRHMEKAVKWDPASAGMRQEYAVMLSAAGKTDEAIAQLQEACRIAPADAEFPYLLALAYNERGDLPRTIETLQRAVQLDPNHSRAWYNLGLALQSAGKSDEAIAALQRGEAADPRDPRIPYARATILAQRGRRDDALAAARRALDIRPDFRPALELSHHLNSSATP